MQYPRADWVEIYAMEHQWERADVRATIDKPGYVSITASNVIALKVRLTDLREVKLNSSTVLAANQRENFSWRAPGYLGDREPVDGVFLVRTMKGWALDQPPCLTCK